MTTLDIHHPPIVLKISPSIIISLDILDPESIRQVMQRLQTEDQCHQGANELQKLARLHAEISNRCFVLGAALWSRHRAMVHQREGRFDSANEHVERYMEDLKQLGVI